MGRDTIDDRGTKPHYAMVYCEDLSSEQVRSLGDKAFRCWVTLKAEAFTDKGYGVVLELLGDYTGYSRRTVQRAVKEIRDAALCKSHPLHNRKGEQLGNHYTIIQPRCVSEARANGIIPPQFPPGRQACRPPWRHDRRPRASAVTPLGRRVPTSF